MLRNEVDHLCFTWSYRLRPVVCLRLSSQIMTEGNYKKEWFKKNSDMVDTNSHSTVCYQHQLELFIELPRESAHVNCSSLHLFSHFSGHKGRYQCNFIGRDIVITSKIQSSSTHREQRTLFIYFFFSGKYASVTIHEFWVVLCNTVFSFPQYRLTFLKRIFTFN